MGGRVMNRGGTNSSVLGVDRASWGFASTTFPFASLRMRNSPERISRLSCNNMNQVHALIHGLNHGNLRWSKDLERDESRKKVLVNHESKHPSGGHDVLRDSCGGIGGETLTPALSQRERKEEGYFFSFSQIAWAISLVPTAVGSLRSGLRS